MDVVSRRVCPRLTYAQMRAVQSRHITPQQLSHPPAMKSGVSKCVRCGPSVCREYGGDVKDAHDRDANIETAFLRQWMEEYAGP